jgi:hypothetical protein
VSELYRHVDVKGRFHREDGPALGYSDGTEMWYIHGVLHRNDGPAVVSVLSDGYTNNDSIERSRNVCYTREWFVDGKRHRTDGPAIERDGWTNDYYVLGRPLTESEFYQYVDTLTGDVLIPPGKMLRHERALLRGTYLI